MIDTIDANPRADQLADPDGVYEAGRSTPTTEQRPVESEPRRPTHRGGMHFAAGAPIRLRFSPWWSVAVVASWLAGALIFFRAQWSSGFNRIMGIAGDTQLAVYLNEHWFKVLHGGEAWRNLPFFYPAKGVLGYTDTFFLWQVFYAPLRVLGCDPFLAFQLTIVALSITGFVCFVVLVRVTMRAPIVVAIVGALVFVFADNLAQHVVSPQMFSIYLVPPIALIGVAAWRLRFGHRVLATSLAAAFGLLAALLLYSNYYVGWFSVLTTAVVTVVFAATGPRTTARDVAGALRTSWLPLLGAAIGIAAGLVPFVVTYLPVVHQQGQRHYAGVMAYAARWSDVVNTGTGNKVWGPLAAHLPSTRTPAAYEVSYAVTPLLLATVVLGGALLAWGMIRSRVARTRRNRLVVSLCVTSVILTILPIKSRFGSLWVVVWHLPGAQAIRAIDRIQVLNDLVVAMALVGLAMEGVRLLRRQARPGLWFLAALVLVAAILGEQVHSTPDSDLGHKQQEAVLASVPMAPSGCTSFYITGTSVYATSIEAMLISQHIDLPTLNGTSGLWPPGWGLFYPQSPSYPAAVRQWMTATGTTSGVCQLDIDTMRWTAHPTLPAS